ncbi:MAG: GGDEF domain-containing protein [Firmicutes bacterium]|nr:GGDEF domain-containing protein [Bacillota bacterium]
MVYKEDQPRLSLCLEKNALLAQLADGKPYSITYRLMIEGEPTYYNLKIVKANTHDDHHIVMGISNVNEQMRESGVSEESDNQLNFKRLAKALTSDMESIYYVDTNSDTYMEFVSDGSYGELKLEISGKNFFDECRSNIQKVVYEEDRSKVTGAMTKETLLTAIRERMSFTMDYRLLIDGVPTYYRLKAIPADDGDREHIIIGVSNIDAQITEEQRLESERHSAAAYSRIAQALAKDYFSIYYVDTETDHFIEYSAHDDYADLGIEKSGEDFFNLSRTNIEKVGHPDDIKPFLKAFTKEKILSELDRNGTFTIKYRLMFGDTPSYVSLKATRMGDSSDNHIVIGVNNIDVQIRREQEYQEALKDTLTYSRIAQALSKDYYSIYYVNIETDEFIEYSSQGEYEELQVEQSGINFFEDCRRNILKLVYHDDLDKALAVWDKEKLLPQLEEGGVFSTVYRLVMNDVPVFINCKVIRMDDEKGDKHIVIGVSNVDSQMRREQELTVAQESANKDPLTGVKSKHAFDDAEAEWNVHISKGEAGEFAIAVCDVNGLKEINDTLGHKAGDVHIQKACSRICKVFQHSPVYRIGGDEFAAILSGQDYEKKDELMALMQAKNEAGEDGGIKVACGIAELSQVEDKSFVSVFKKADEAMYENKRQLKGIS